MATLAIDTVKQQLIHRHHQLIMKLEHKCADIFQRTLQQKTMILLKIQEKFNDEMERIHRSEKTMRVQIIKSERDGQSKNDSHSESLSHENQSSAHQPEKKTTRNTADQTGGQGKHTDESDEQADAEDERDGVKVPKKSGKGKKKARQKAKRTLSDMYE